MDLLDSMQDLGNKDQLESARTELSAAKSQNASLKNKIHTLNSTVSSLTSENESLKAEVAALREMLSFAPPPTSTSKSPSTLSPLFPPPPPTSLTLSTSILAPSKSNITAVASTSTLTYTAHSDRSIHSIIHGLYDTRGELLPTRSTSPPTSCLGTLSAPVIALEVVANQLFAACLDGKVYYLNLEEGGDGVDVFKEFSTKHNQRITNMIEFQGKILTADTGGFIKVASPSTPSTHPTTYRLETPIISICCDRPTSPTSPTQLFVYADGVHIHRYKVPLDGAALGDAELINVNKGGDTHRSYRILHMALSPNSDYLACQTDRGRIAIYSLTTPTITLVRSLYGHQGDDFFIGLCYWDLSGSRILSNSHDNDMFVYDVSTGDAKQVITGSEGGEGHKAKIRDMKVFGDTMTTAGWDGYIKIWIWC